VPTCPNHFFFENLLQLCEQSRFFVSAVNCSSLADDTRPWEHVGDDLDEVIAARERKQAYFEVNRGEHLCFPIIESGNFLYESQRSPSFSLCDLSMVRQRAGLRSDLRLLRCYNGAAWISFS
jgi:hypothetical protein